MFTLILSGCELNLRYREDSKQATKREVDFSRKLNDVFSLLKRVEESTRGSSSAADAHNLDWLLETHRPTADVADTLWRFVASDRMKIREDFKGTLRMESPVVDEIYQGLTSRYWRREWQPEYSRDETQDGGGGRLLTPAVLVDLIRPMTESLLVEKFGGRGEAIQSKFRATYLWAFDRQPRHRTQGPQWHSLPDWLEGTSHSLYWVTGKPASGKSTFMKFIAESPATVVHLEKWSSPLPVLVLNYYAGHSPQRSWDGLKKSILHQALGKRPELVSVISPRRWALATALPYSERFPSWESWEVDESFNLLLKRCGRTCKLALFIDGLDEFDIHPREVVKLVNEIASTSTDFLKVCVASRPWTQFDDAFHQVPMLQLHHLTQDDIRTFVAGQLDANPGFHEFRNIYQVEADEIKEEIATKSQGVFLWVSVVVGSIVHSLEEGQNISIIRATLKVLPSDISKLYDTIWAGIRGRKRRDGSWMIQVVMAAQGPLSCLSIWLADESRTTRAYIEKLPFNMPAKAPTSLKRRLASRTRGILEMTGGTDKLVDFCHRTAKDWAKQDGVWDDIQTSYGEDFDPNFVLFEAETLALSRLDGAREYRQPSQLWAAITKALWYASQSCERAAYHRQIVDLMDFFDTNIQRTFSTAQLYWSDYLPRTHHWSTEQSLSGPHSTFMGIAAQFSMLPYIRTKAGPNLELQNLKGSRDRYSLVDCAMFGYEYFNDPTLTDFCNLPPIPAELRLATVAFLLDAGSTPRKKYRARLEELKRKHAQDEPKLEYYERLLALIKAKRGVRGHAKATLGRISSVFA